MQKRKKKSRMTVVNESMPHEQSFELCSCDIRKTHQSAAPQHSYNIYLLLSQTSVKSESHSSHTEDIKHSLSSAQLALGLDMTA